MESTETKIARLEEQLKGAREALELQAKSYERQLEDLKIESERLRSVQQKYVLREIYEYGHRELAGKVEAMMKIVYVACGAVGLLEVLLRFIK